MKEVEENFCFFTKWIISVLVLVFFILAESLSAKGNILSIKGKEGSPYFDLHGNFNTVYINPYGGISLATVQEEIDNFQRVSIQDINYSNNVNFIHAKKDNTGKIWLVWEERESEKSDLYIGLLKNKRIANQINLTADQKGFNFSPYISFSLRNELWVTWVNYFQGKYIILVKNVTSDQIWEINSSLNSSVHSPHIILDGTGRIWLFWVGQLRNRDEILYSHFDGERWREPLSLNQNSDVPHITPSISLDLNGFPHVVWSAYDGNDYELYYSYWDGYKWRKEKKITNNQDTADTSPSISLLFDTIPIVAWSRYINEKHEVCLAYKIGEKWSSGINISRDENITSSPKIISLGGKIGILRQEKAEIKVTILHFHKLYESSYLKKKVANLPRIHASDFSRILDLDDDKYIGFGDSITYGVINHEDAPDKGYVPRLERLIDENIRNSKVVNHGIGGEKTSEGLSRIRSVINGEQAQTIFIMEGTNDVKDTNISTDTAAFNLQGMARRSLDLGATPFLASIIPLDPWQGIRKERTLELNKKIKSAAARLNISFVNQFDSFSENSDKKDTLYSDSTHPNENGYEIIAENWYEALIDSMPSIDINETSLAFEGIHGESNPPSQTFEVRNSGGGNLNYQISFDEEWISVSPIGGDSRREWDEIEVSVDISNLTEGDYEGNVTISSENASNSPQILTVQLTISQPTIELDKTSLSFEGKQGEADPTPQTFSVRNSGTGTLNYQISADQVWISVSPTGGDSTGEWDEIEVSVDISNLTEGDYEGEVRVSSENASNSPQILTVQLTILQSTIELDKTSLSFEGKQGEADPAPQTFSIRNSGTGTLNYQISTDQVWIILSSTSGDSTGEWDEIEVSVDISNLTEGDYEGNVTVSSENASNSPQVLTVQLKILGPRIELDKTTFSFEGVQGESNPPAQVFRIRNSGAGTLNYQISTDQVWVGLSSTSGDSTGEWDEIEVSIDISNLTEGDYEGNVTVSSENASNNPQVLTVQLKILSPIIELDKTSLSFEGTAGEENPSSQTLRIRNSGAGTLNYQISTDQVWIGLSSTSGDSTGEWDEIEVSIDISNLTKGDYEGNMTVSSENASNNPQVLTVQLKILSPIIELDKTSLSFEGTAGEENPSSQTFRIRNSGAGTLNYQISADQVWIILSSTSGDSTGEWDEISVSVDISNLTKGDYEGNVTISSEYASNSPQKLEINLTIKLPPLFPPLNFHGKKNKNRSLSQLEYINILKWESNPQNKLIEEYNIYLMEGENKILLVEVNTQTFEYWHRKVEANKVYKYGLTARDKFGRESETVYIEVR